MNPTHINYAPHDESAPRLCGWEGCGALLTYVPLIIPPNSDMRRAIDLHPIDRTLVVDAAGPSSPHLKRKDRAHSQAQSSRDVPALDAQALDPPGPDALPFDAPGLGMPVPGMPAPGPGDAAASDDDGPPAKRPKVVVPSSDVVDVEEDPFGGISFRPIIPVVPQFAWIHSGHALIGRTYGA